MDSIKLVLVNYAVCALLGSIFEFIFKTKVGIKVVIRSIFLIKYIEQ